MDVYEQKILRKWHKELIENIQPEIMAPELYSMEIIDESLYEEILRKDIPNANKCAFLLFSVKRKCSMTTFLQCLEKDYKFISDGIWNDLVRFKNVHKSKSVRNSLSRYTFTKMDNYLEIFSEKLKVKIHNSDVKPYSNQIYTWVGRLISSLSNSNVSLSERRRLADCCFVLLDSLAVLQRTHSKRKEFLWRENVYDQMKNMISQTSNPLLSSIRFNARFGAALALGKDIQKGLEYVEIALKDALQFLPGRDIGNCLYALVNIKLQQYPIEKSVEIKEEIVQLIERGIYYFMEEREEIRVIWRCVYLDKMSSCCLALDNMGIIIPDVKIGDSDIKKASECLAEMGNLVNGMDKRRKMHYYRLKGRYHAIKKEFCISKGYLEEALKLCNEAELHFEREIIEDQLHKTEENFKCIFLENKVLGTKEAHANIDSFHKDLNPSDGECVFAKANEIKNLDQAKRLASELQYVCDTIDNTWQCELELSNDVSHSQNCCQHDCFNENMVDECVTTMSRLLCFGDLNENQRSEIY